MRNGMAATPMAVELLRQGLHPVALYPQGVKISTQDGAKTATGKEPIGSNWGLTRPSEDAITQVLRQHPGAGIGLVLGPRGGIVDIEVDGPGGEESLLRLMGGEVVETLGWFSRRGPHHIFRWDERVEKVDPKRRAKFTLPEYPGLEFRFGYEQQTQSACPPTRGEDGKARRWNDVDEIAELPEIAIENLRLAFGSPGPRHVAALAETFTRKVQSRESAWFRKTLENEAGKVAMAEEGTRHNHLIAAARTLGGMIHHGYLAEAEITAALTQAGLRAGLAESEVAETIRDGLAYGKAEPLPWPDKLTKPTATTIESITVMEADDDAPLPPPDWPAPPGDAAYHGLAGEAVRLVEPHTEADPLAILAQTLVAFGNAIGRGPHMLVDGARHGVNEFLVIVGETAAARKGTSKARAMEILREADPAWMADRVRSGLSSGEGLITPVRDSVSSNQPIKERGRVVGHERVVTDEGETDKRLLIVETEFGACLRALERDGNKLSALLRAAWDGDNLATLTKSPLRATEPHISILGHITFGELRALLSTVDISGGLANRITWLCARRARHLPFGGSAVGLGGIQAKFRESIDFARDVREMTFSPSARHVYADHYARLSTSPPGVLGEVTSRAAAHVIRWAMIYALVDRSGMVRDDHVLAALAVVDASNRAAAHIFGDSLGHPDAEKILGALRANPNGMTRSEIHVSVFRNNANRERIDKSLSFLVQYRAVREQRVETGGRPAFRYYANERNERNKKSHLPRGVLSSNSFLSFPPSENGAAAREVIDS